MFVDISGATDTTYVPAAADEYTLLRVVVTASNPDGSVIAWSGPTGPIGPTPPINTTLPLITGTARVGAALSATSGTFSPADASLAYQWQRGTTAAGFTDITGANASGYTLVAADAGVTVRVKVTATNVDGSATATSAPTAPIAQPPNSTRPPAAPSGTLMDTYKLTADSGGWDVPTATFTYSWLRCPRRYDERRLELHDDRDGRDPCAGRGRRRLADRGRDHRHLARRRHRPDLQRAHRPGRGTATDERDQTFDHRHATDPADADGQGRQLEPLTELDHLQLAALRSRRRLALQPGRGRKRRLRAQRRGPRPHGPRSRDGHLPRSHGERRERTDERRGPAAAAGDHRAEHRREGATGQHADGHCRDVDEQPDA